MKDINNNFNPDKIQISKIDYRPAKSASKDEDVANCAKKEINNLDKDHSVLLGRSMVKRMPKVSRLNPSQVESIKSSLEQLDANYKLNKLGIIVADAALQQGASYERAVKIGQEFIDMHK